jgi:hypothetical protein
LLVLPKFYQITNRETNFIQFIESLSGEQAGMVWIERVHLGKNVVREWQILPRYFLDEKLTLTDFQP